MARSRSKWVDQRFGEWLRAERVRRGWTQPQLADMLNDRGIAPMHTTTIAKIESAGRSVRINEAVAVADLFGASLDWVLGREPDDSTFTFAMTNVSSYAGTAGRHTTSAAQTAADLADILEDVEERFDVPKISELVRLADDAANQLELARVGYEQIQSLATQVSLEAGDSSGQT